MAITLDQFSRRVGRIGPRLTKAIVGAMRAGLLLSLKTSKREFFQGGGGKPNPPPGPLKNRSGKLKGSVRIIEPKPRGRDILGGLVAGGPGVPYARIHERGGVTRAHEILPKRGSVLSWVDKTGVRRFSRRVRHPGSKIPPRPYLQPAILKNLKQIEKQLAVAFEVEFGKVFR